MRPRQREAGQAAILVMVLLSAILGFAALAVDISSFEDTRRQMQAAADSAAMAGVHEILAGESSTTVTSAAQNDASLNGFTNGSNNGNLTVTVNNPPKTGPYTSDSQAVEVIVQNTKQPTFFLLGLGMPTASLSARAVAIAPAAAGCIYALDPLKSAAGAFDVTGNITVTSSCGLLVNSSDSDAMEATGNVAIDTAATGVVGNYTSTGNVTWSPKPVTGIPPFSDPLAYVQPPSVGSCTQAAANKSGMYTASGSSPVTVPVGVYPGGISVSGSSVTFSPSGGTYGNGITISSAGGTITFNPGQYQSGGSGASITIEGSAGAVFNSGSYTFCGGLSIVGNNVVTLSPGLYSGGISITGNASVTLLSGTYVLAGGGLSVTGNATLTGSGVTFYNTYNSTYAYAPISLTGNTQMNLSAPTSGAMEGMLFFQDRTVSGSAGGSTITGNSSSTFNGAVYFPTTALTYVGNSAVNGYTLLIANTVSITGNSTIGNNYSSLANGDPIRTAVLGQ